MEQKVSDIMREDVYTTKKSTSIVDAVKEMKSRKIGSVVVVSDAEALGIVTSTDVLYKAIAEGLDLKKTTVGDIMSSPLVVVGPDATPQEAVSLMAEYKIKKLPVVVDGKLIGILAASDLITQSPEFMNVLVNLVVPGAEQQPLSS